MNGTELLGPPGPDDGGHDEEELRVLLRRAVPALASPEDRMERVLARVERSRRRRRAAGLAAGLAVGLSAAVLAAAPALAPSPVRGAALGPAGSGAAQAPTVPPLPTASATPTAAPTGSRLFFPRLPEMVLDPPPGWHAMATLPADPQEKFGYLGTEALGPEPSCTAGAARCPLYGRLPVDGVVLSFRLVDGQGLAGKIGAGPPALADTGLDKDCAALGGSRELAGLRTVDRSGAGAVVEVTACLRQPSEPTLLRVRQVFASIRSVPVTQPPLPSPPGTVSPAATP
ncbi:hypothetical protein ACWD4P_26305 [Kitasatospora sp. NPDC002543]